MLDSLTSLIFGNEFNQGIEPNSLPESLTTLTFGCNFNQNIDLNIIPSNLKYIEFDWINFNKHDLIKQYIEMVNNIPSYYDVKIFLSENILGVDPKWPIHVYEYDEDQWSLELCDVIDNYEHSHHGNITVLINKKTYQPYSYAKSTIK